MSSKQDQIIDGNVLKGTPSEDHSLRVNREKLRLKDDGRQRKAVKEL